METKGFLFPGGIKRDGGGGSFKKMYLFLSSKVSLKRKKVTFQILLSLDPSPWIQEVKWTYIRRWEDVLGMFWRSYVHLGYVLCPEGLNKKYKIKRNLWRKLNQKEILENRTVSLRVVSGSKSKQLPLVKKM